jgi:hypothetical protein
MRMSEDSTPDVFDQAIAGFQLGESETLLRLQGPTQFRQASLLIVSQTKRQLHIVTPDFEPDRFNNVEFADALSHFARRSQYAEVRILVGNPLIAIRWGHQVVSMARRLTSSIHVRRLNAEDFDPEEAWIVADDIGLLRRDSSQELVGMLSAKAIPQAQQKNRRFAEWWERSHEVPEFREMYL